MGTQYKPTTSEGGYQSTEIFENYNATNSPGYPAFDNETLLGTVLLPKIYGKGLNALEIASSGSIILSVNDFETMDISSDGTKNTFQAKRGLELNFQPNDSDTTVHVGDHTWSSESYGSSNYQVMRTSKGDGYMLSNSLLVTSSATFKGDAHFEGDTFGIVSSKVDLTGDTHIEGTLRVTSNVTFDSDLEVLGDVNIIGNINVTGVVNTTSVTQLHAEDKIIQLSTHSNSDLQNENSVSDGAGVLIQGVLAPTTPMDGFDARYDTLELLNSNNNKIIEKSLTWNNNGGVEKMGMLLCDPEIDEPQLEPYWEMRGGGLRITQQVYNDAANAFVDVSFALRINAREELEILKCVTSNDTSDCKRVARFGAQGHLGRGDVRTRAYPINLNNFYSVPPQDPVTGEYKLGDNGTLNYTTRTGFKFPLFIQILGNVTRAGNDNELGIFVINTKPSETQQLRDISVNALPFSFSVGAGDNQRTSWTKPSSKSGNSTESGYIHSEIGETPRAIAMYIHYTVTGELRMYGYVQTNTTDTTYTQNVFSSSASAISPVYEDVIRDWGVDALVGFFTGNGGNRSSVFKIEEEKTISSLISPKITIG
jgi:hypothetical protein